jgi:hypothetical protein
MKPLFLIVSLSQFIVPVMFMQRALIIDNKNENYDLITIC